MKRGKDGEKVMGPMFPRLHVNDTEKGGPRAPPRNKMALYEQLSIPSQRFNPGDMPLNPNNTANLVPPYSSQGDGHERGVLFSKQLPALRRPVESPPGCTFVSNAPLRRVESRQKTQENEYRVPIFVNSNVDQAQGKFYNNPDKEMLTPSNKVLSGCSDKELKEFSGQITRQHGKCQNEGNSKQFRVSTEHNCKGTSDSLSMNNPEGIVRQTDQFSHFKPRDNLASTCGEVHNTNIVRLECRSGSEVDCTIRFKSVRDVDNGDSSFCLKDLASEEHINTNNLINDTHSQDGETCKSSQMRKMDHSDDSETSMVEYISEMDISPDDVVKIIGRKYFWKARRAIANQQRVLAVQVFELHRLLKVQKLIAGSPNVMLEDGAFLGKPVKNLSAKILPLEYSVKTPENVSKRKHNSEKLTSRTECNAENSVEKTSPFAVQNGSQPSSCRSLFSEKPPPAPVKHDSQMNPWCFNQPSGHQWLVPVMSPSEGLVYKPHPGPAFMTPVYGGGGPPRMTPLMGNSLAPQYGVPPSHHVYQGMGVPFASPTSHSYFPPFGMSAMNPVIPSPAIDQSNQVAATGFQGQLSEGGANLNNQYHNSSNIASKKNENATEAVRSYPSRDSELQASTASSPSERTHRVDIGNSTGGRSVFRPFPTTPAISKPNRGPHDHFPNHPARVIKVVPHNARSATESAARIFQSIQEERKQY